MRLLICAGGTGGGVYPALAVLQALMKDKAQAPEAVLWVGGVGGMEADLVKRAQVDFEPIPAAGVHGVGLRTLPGNLLQLSRGVLHSRRILRRFRPDVLFFTGGYVAVPMAVAGRGFPSVLYVPDIEPGLALKTLARFAACAAVTAEESRAYFPQLSANRVQVTGYPTRPELARWDRAAAFETLRLSPDLPTLLVAGGSKGARSINRALLGALDVLLEEMQVVHISGQLDWPEVETAQSHLAGTHAERYRAFPYLHAEMGAALTAADLVVSRAGASALGEYPLFGLPAVLVPYPYAWRYQKVNADYLIQRGAAVLLTDGDLEPQLVPTVQGLMRDLPRRAAMRTAMQALNRPHAAEEIGGLLHRLARPSGQGRN